MHKLIEYICDELEELERKAEKDGKLSMAEVQYGDMLAHFKKNLLKAEEMSDDMGYSGIYHDGMPMHDKSYARGGSYARGRRGANQYGSYAMGGRYANEDGYSRNQDIITELHELMNEAPDEKTRKEFQRFIQKMEMM